MILCSSEILFLSKILPSLTVNEFWFLSGVLADVVANNEELQKAATQQNVVQKLADFLLREDIPAKQLEGVLLALSELCSRLEESRRQLLEFQVGPSS